jgi:hypothetical protein
VRDEVFQISELVEPYRVAPSIDFEENSNFCVFDDSLVDVDTEELNVDEDDMISILNIAMELMTNQLTTKKKKILTNYLYYIIIFL